MDPEEESQSPQSRSSIEITRSATNGKYGWHIKHYRGDDLTSADIWNAVEADAQLRELYTSDTDTNDLIAKLQRSIAEKRQEQASNVQVFPGIREVQPAAL